MKIILSILLIFNFSLSYSQNVGDLVAPNEYEDEDIEILGITLNLKYCRNVQDIAAIGQAWSQVYWGSIGAPGFVTGAIQNDSIILKMCAYLIKVRTLDTEGAVYATAAFLNELTDNKWNHHFEFLDKTWNVANSFYDVRGNGGFRKGALTNASNHRRLINYWDSATKYYQTVNDEEPTGMVTTADRKREIDEISGLAYEQAVLTEALSCPNPRVKANYREAYQKKVVPLNQIRIESKRNIKYFRRQMLKMGAAIAGANVESQKKFIIDLNGFVESAYIYKARDKKYTVEREINSPTKKDKEGKPAKVNDNKTYTYQEVSAISNPQNIVQSFRKKYVEQWQSYVNAQKYSGTKGLLNDRGGLIEKKFKSVSFECSEFRLRQLPGSQLARLENDPSYRSVYNQEYEKCQNNLRYSNNKVGNTQVDNLMHEYIIRLNNELLRFKGATAGIWTFESKYLGINPILKAGTDAAKKELENRQKDPETCRPNFSAAEMLSYDMQINSVNVKINEKIMREMSKRNMLEQAKAEAESKDLEEVKKDEERKNEFIKEQSRSNKYSSPVVRPGGVPI